MDPDAIYTIARHEIRVQASNRWIGLFAVVFAALAVAISYFGLATAGSIGFQGFERTAASLLNLVLYLIPLVALVMSTMSLSSERGVSELLFSQPVTRLQVLAGKILGMFAALGAATLLGFGVAGILIGAQTGMGGMPRFAAMVGMSLLLGFVFLCLGALIAILSSSRVKAMGSALFLWFFLVFFYDLIVIGTTFVLKERTANQMIFLSIFANPVDLARVSGLLAMGDPAIFGVAGASLLKFLGGAATSQILLILALILWAVGPFWATGSIMKRKDL
jgi:Cu-processing system permease protein